MVETDRTLADRQDKVLEKMRERVVAAIDDACKTFADNMSVAGRNDPPPPRENFASRVMQLGYCLQCGASVDTFEGGDPGMARHAIKNAVDISNHYWGSNFELSAGSDRSSDPRKAAEARRIYPCRPVRERT